jgi:CubicO group peptidase (beta-lactamase class C family)
LKEYMEALAELPLNYQPGSSWLYGQSHDVLGYLVEVVSGQPLGEFVQQRILDPLQMEDTHYWPPSSKDQRRAIVVVEGRDDRDGTSRRPRKATEQATLITGASGLHSTAADFWRFSQMLLNGGELDGRRLLGPRTVARIAQEHIPARLFGQPGRGFGLGHAVTIEPAAQGFYYSAGSYYWAGGLGTLFWVDQKEELTGILMVQRSRMTPINQQGVFAEIVYSAILD